jgi:hypothetical protein
MKGVKMNSNPSVIAEKVKSLTSEQLAEVETFIEFIRYRSHDHELTHNAAGASTPAFEAIWDNPEDAAYDAL